ncbi:unnamed protein product [Notodromas monacha]|uniref:F-box domain-containing protein n=1 Tax=Notodromas monacha TaxID=399045 RepID=A0A7R9GGZ6_9CRUS|nr:unnamed protein product [Notodromas monacha]CAG0922369.1 unnamed protein product [Notodromas monacha]
MAMIDDDGEKAISPLNDLPDEILIKIFGYLDSSRDIPKVARVCKRFHSIATDEIVWFKNLLTAGIFPLSVDEHFLDLINKLDSRKADPNSDDAHDENSPDWENFERLARSNYYRLLLNNKKIWRLVASNKMLIKDCDVKNPYHIFQLTATIEKQPFPDWACKLKTRPEQNYHQHQLQRPVEEPAKTQPRIFTQIKSFITSAGKFLKSAKYKTNELDEENESKQFESDPFYMMFGPGLDSPRTKKIVVQMMLSNFSGVMKGSSLDIMNASRRRNVEDAPGIGHGIRLMSHSGPIEVVTVYNTRARQRDVQYRTNFERMTASGIFQHADSIDENSSENQWVLQDGIRAASGYSSGFLYVVDGRAENLDGSDPDSSLEMRCFIRPISPTKPILVLNCQEEPDSPVISNFELAIRLRLFDFPNPVVVIRVDSRDVLHSGRMGFAWMKLRNHFVQQNKLQ